MNPLKNLEQVGDCAIYRPKGHIPPPEATRLLSQAITWTRTQKIPKLLLDLTGMERLEMPNLADRYFIMREFAALAQSAVKIAFVVPPELVGDKFGVMVGKNAGLTSEVFTNEAAAIAWLHAEK